MNEELTIENGESGNSQFSIHHSPLKNDVMERFARGHERQALLVGSHALDHMGLSVRQSALHDGLCLGWGAETIDPIGPKAVAPSQ
jgi:hypothetical protein